jgi:hypothetical protein
MMPFTHTPRRGSSSGCPHPGAVVGAHKGLLYDTDGHRRTPKPSRNPFIFRIAFRDRAVARRASHLESGAVVKWALIHERDARAQIAAINALLMLHGVVIRHSTVRLLNRMAATRDETSKLLAEIEATPGAAQRACRLPIPGYPEQG